MKKTCSCTVASACSLLMLGTAVSSWACGQNSLTITNLPTAGGFGLQANAINSAGQITGLFYPPGQPGAHTFLYSAGALTDLGGLGGPSSQGLAINASGQVAGDSDTADGAETHACLYGSGTVTDLGTLGGVYSSPTALNDAGQVVGLSLTAGNAGLEAFLYANGSMTSLGTLGGDYSYAYALNNAGQAVGESSLASGDLHGFVFSGGAMSDVGTLGGTYSSAFALNESGMVVGESSLANGEMHAFLYAAGTINDLGTLGGTYSSAVAINQAGQVIGTASTPNGQTHGFIYSGGAMTDLGAFAGGQCAPTAINKFGQVVGQSITANGSYHAFLWQGGSLVDLNSLLPTNSGWELLTADFIQDSGRIVGSGIYNNSAEYFILDLAPANTAPVAVAGPDQTVDCQAEVTLQASQSYDPDGDQLAYEWSLAGYVLGTNPVFAAYFPLGTNVITLKVTDPCSASSQTNLIVRVIDSTPPSLSCPAPFSAASDSNCQAPVPNLLSQVAATDNCTPTASLVIIQSPLPGAFLGLGQHAIAVTVVDSCGNTTTSNVLFNVLDTTPPVIQSLSVTPTVLTPPRHQMVPVTVSLSALDNCDAAPVSKIVSITCNEAVSADEIQVTGNLTALLTASRNGGGGGRVYTLSIGCTDASGNRSTGTVTVTVPQGNGNSAETIVTGVKNPKAKTLQN